MNFSCSGNISNWTFVARSRTGQGRDQYPLFQFWRHDGKEKYERVYESNSSVGVFGVTESESEFTVGKYIPNSPVTFEDGYIFGVYQPRRQDSRLTMRYASVTSGYGYPIYRRESKMPLEEFDTDGSPPRNDYPLVAVSTGENALTFSDKSEAYEPPALCYSDSVLLMSFCSLR